MYRMCISRGSMRGLFVVGFVCSVYVIVSVGKWAITCVFGNGPVYEE